MDTLQFDMNAFYTKRTTATPVKASELKNTPFYASMHPKNHAWCRVRVQSVVDRDSVLVRYVDYGDVCVREIGELRPLFPFFRNLPMQAIVAKLSSKVLHSAVVHS